jgi:hypothetical protein
MVLWVEAVHERLHEAYLVPFARFRHPPIVIQAAYQRLLAQDVLAGICRCDDPLCVKAIGKWEVDSFDVRVGEEFFMR